MNKLPVRTGSLLILPQGAGRGGPASFRARFTRAAEAEGVQIVRSVEDGCQAVLVIGGTSRLDRLIQLRRRGLRIVQRLNGMNWVHRLGHTGIRHYLRAEYNNRILALIRRYLADVVIYQSGFSRDWWQERHGESGRPHTVIYNGTDLDEFRPAEGLRNELKRVLMVEGNLGGGYEIGLDNGIALVQELAQRGVAVELAVAGRMSGSLQERAEAKAGNLLRVLGALPREEIPALCRGADLFFSGDVNAACPNAVIEALACGLPVLAYDTGALREMLAEQGGRTVPWGSDYWKLERPETGPLADAAQEILHSAEKWRAGARQRAVEAFDIRAVTRAYLDVLLG